MFKYVFWCLAYEKQVYITKVVRKNVIDINKWH